MPDDFDSPESPFIRISRNGAMTDHAQEAVRTRAVRGSARSLAIESEEEYDQMAETPLTEAPPAIRRNRNARPMPKRLSEEAREAAEAAEIQEQPEIEVPPAAKIKRTRASKKKEAEQIALPLKPQRAKIDAMVKQRQVLGFSCIVIAILVLLAIVSYSPSDAPFAETRFSDVPAIFTGSDPIVNAHADQVHNWLRLLGAMLADFLINKTIGYAAIIYPIFFGAWSLAFFKFTHKQRRRLTLATTFFLITAILFSATVGTAANFLHIPREWSGAVGQFLGLAFTRLIGAAGAFIVYASAFIITLVFSIDLDIEHTFLRLKGYWTGFILFTRRQWIAFWDRREEKREEKEKMREAEELELQVEEAEASETGFDDSVRISRADEKPAEKQSAPQPIVKVVAESATASQAEFSKLKSFPKTIAVEVVAAASDVIAAAPPATATGNGTSTVPEAVTIVRSAGPASAPVPQVVVPGQPLLKVRPAPKPVAGGPIPRMTRTDQSKLGERSMSFSRLTNGAISPESESLPGFERPTPAAPKVVTPPVEIVPLDGITPLSGAESTHIPGAVTTADVSNVDLSEAVIQPTAPRLKSDQKITDRPSPRIVEVVVGDEKVLSNEALPHSADSEDFRSLIRDSSPAPAKAGVTENLFYEEGEKPFVPENPYQEILIKYRNPTIDLLTLPDPKDELDANDEELAKKGRLLRDKLATFGVEIENITVTPGPVVTLYEFTPAEGIKVSRVENLTDDIALAMKARGIRIIAPIPGRGTIGVEIPNDDPKMVRISSLFNSDAFRNTKMNLPLALGKTISGDVYIDDLNKMPHLLIAGATGSGKSVGVNGILASLLYAKSPRDVKFVIVDPKKIELSLYKKLRKHYLIVSPEAGEDIVTTPAFAVLALKAVELEMERRYDKLAKAAVRSLADYNIKVAQGKLRSTQEEQHYHLPYIVVVIDELADLMITAGRDIEEPICRIAQMARAVGIHLILATQRPSVDVITGVIKANFPARMAFQVATRVDSRTILDCMGAEQLLGNGDMLYQPSGTPKPIRLQSPFISTEEVELMIDAVAMQDGDKLSYSRPWTLPSLKQKDGRGGPAMDDDEDSRDELFEEAARVIVRHQQGSVSLLQRRLKVGYSRAARIVDELEQAAIVGAFDGSKARQVLCETEEELELVLEGLR